MATNGKQDGSLPARILSGSPFGIIALDDTGSVVFTNRKIEDALGHRTGGYRDKHITELWSDTSETPDSVFRETGGSSPDIPETPFDATLLAEDGSRVRVTVFGSTVEVGEKERVVLWVRERRGAEGTEGRVGRGEERTETEGETAGVAGKAETPDGRFEDGHGPRFLEALTEACLGLSRAGCPGEVADAVLAAAERLLLSDVACVRYLDDETNELEPAATTEEARSLMGSRKAFDLDTSIAGRALRSGDPVVDRPGDEREPEGCLPGRARLHAPIGEKGTLTVFKPEGSTVSDAEVTAARGICSVAGASLERIERECGRGDEVGGGEKDESEAEDRTKAVELTHDFVRETVDCVSGGGTREEIGERVRDLLVASDRYSGAWFLDTEEEDGVGPMRWSADGVPNSVVPADTADDGGGGALREAVESDEIRFVRRRKSVTDAPSETEPGETAADEETDVVVPVSHNGRTYGALVVSTAGEPGVGRVAHTELRVLKSVLGLAIYATKNKELLLSEKVLRLEFEVTDPGCLAVAVSDEAGCYCEVEHSTLTSEGNSLIYMRVEGAPPEDACEAAERVGSVADCRLIERSGGDGLIEVVKSRSGAEVMTNVGATVPTATAEDGVGRLVVEAPVSADVRSIVDAYTDLNPESRLVSKREVDRPVPARGLGRESIDELLTERQRSALETAYYAGYYDWPRGNTAERIAESLGISPATFHQHIRKAEQEIVETVCDFGD